MISISFWHESNPEVYELFQSPSPAVPRVGDIIRYGVRIDDDLYELDFVVQKVLWQFGGPASQGLIGVEADVKGLTDEDDNLYFRHQEINARHQLGLPQHP